MKHITVNILLVIFCIYVLAGCNVLDNNGSSIQENQNNYELNSSLDDEQQKNSLESIDNNFDLSSWVGCHYFLEHFEPEDVGPTFMGYLIMVFENDGQYFATIDIDGRMTGERLTANILGDEDKIEFVLSKQYVGFRTYNEGDILMGFEREDSETIYTNWGEIQPLFEENSISGEVYFETIAESPLILQSKEEWVELIPDLAFILD